MLFSVPYSKHSTHLFSKLFKVTQSAINSFNLKEADSGNGICRIIAVIMLKPIRKITLKMIFSVPCCDSQQIFFCGSPR